MKLNRTHRQTAQLSVSPIESNVERHWPVLRRTGISASPHSSMILFPFAADPATDARQFIHPESTCDAPDVERAGPKRDGSRINDSARHKR
jgi:hypothetical protein